jgi:hypothetical protein
MGVSARVPRFETAPEKGFREPPVLVEAREVRDLANLSAWNDLRSSVRSRYPIGSGFGVGSRRCWCKVLR